MSIEHVQGLEEIASDPGKIGSVSVVVVLQGAKAMCGCGSVTQLITLWIISDKRDSRVVCTVAHPLSTLVTTLGRSGHQGSFFQVPVVIFFVS